jgi:hypothetical protein
VSVAASKLALEKLVTSPSQLTRTSPVKSEYEEEVMTSRMFGKFAAFELLNATLNVADIDDMIGTEQPSKHVIVISSVELLEAVSKLKNDERRRMTTARCSLLIAWPITSSFLRNIRTDGKLS